MTIHYEVETYDHDTVLVNRESKTLMQLRVFCEQEMYPKLNSGELHGIVIFRREKDDSTGKTN